MNVFTKDFVFFPKDSEEVIAPLRAGVEFALGGVLSGELMEEFWLEVKRIIEVKRETTTDFEIVKNRLFALGKK